VPWIRVEHGLRGRERGCGKSREKNRFGLVNRR